MIIWFRSLIVFFLVLRCPTVFSNENDKIIIQVNGQYYSIQDAAKKKEFEVVRCENRLFLKKDALLRSLNNENIVQLFGNTKLSILFRNIFPNAVIYLDNFQLGKSDNSGNAKFSQLYPESGNHTLRVAKNNEEKTFNFYFSHASNLTCTGKSKFHCSLGKE